MPCSRWSSRRGPRAIRGSGRASTTVTPRSSRRTRRLRRSSARSRRARPRRPRAATPPSSWPTRRRSERRSKRRPRRSRAQRPAKATTASPTRRLTCSTTWPCCWHRAGSASATRSRRSMAVAADTANLDISPGIGEVRELAREHTLVPLRHTFIDDCETPVSAYLKLRGAGPSFLLESAEQGQRFGRWSFLGVQPRSVIRLADGVLTVDGAPREFDDPYRAVTEELARYKLAELPDLPPFAGGAVGLFGYDLVRWFEPTVGEANPDDVGIPDLALMVSDVLLAFDHFTHEVTVLANVFADGGDLEARYDEAVAAIVDVRERLSAPVPRTRVGRREPPTFVSNMGADGYAQAVERCKEYIRAGDVYQVVPSQRWSADLPVDAFSIYRGLRAVNPSPYMYFLDFEDFQIAGASPEALVTVRGREARQRPIAGTQIGRASCRERV